MKNMQNSSRFFSHRPRTGVDIVDVLPICNYSEVGMPPVMSLLFLVAGAAYMSISQQVTRGDNPGRYTQPVPNFLVACGHVCYMKRVENLNQ